MSSAASVLHEHRLAFDDRNLFLLVTLGLVSVCREFTQIIVSEGAAVERDFHPDLRPCPLLDATLGLASITRTVAEVLSDVSLPNLSALAPSMPGSAEPPEDLRKFLV